MADQQILEELVQEIAEKENYREYDVSNESGSNKGDNYMSKISVVKVSGITRMGKKKTIDMLVKAPLSGTHARESAQLREVFEREVFFYQTLCGIYDDLQNQYGIKDELRYTQHPKLYHFSLKEEREAIMLENLKVSGYSMWDRTQPMNHEHIEIVMKAYGKLHGMSYVFKEKEPARFEELANSLDNLFESQFENSLLAFQKEVDKWIGYYDANRDANWKIIQRLKSYKANIRSTLQELSVYTGNHPVFVHGDCWCNNFLFKYGSSQKPIDVKMVDFQVLKIGNPVTDLAYFFYSTADEDIYKNYVSYLRIYHNSMKELVEGFDLNIESILPFNVLLDEYWKKYSTYGLLVSSFIFKVIYSKPEEALSIEDESVGDNVLEAFCNKKIDNEDLIIARIKRLIKHMIDNNFI